MGRQVMITNWSPGFDAEIGYRMERAKADFRRHHRARTGTEARNPHTRSWFGRRAGQRSQ
jgi:hypothetical protein